MITSPSRTFVETKIECRTGGMLKCNVAITPLMHILFPEAWHKCLEMLHVWDGWA